MKKVVVTGIGAVSPLGNSFSESWASAKAGLSGIAAITRFNADGMKWGVSGEVKGLDLPAFFSQKELAHIDLFVQYAVAASLMAAEDAGLRQNPETLKHESEKGKNRPTSELSDFQTSGPDSSGGVIIGSSRGGITTIENSLKGFKRLSPYVMLSTSIGMAASYSSYKMGIKSYCLGISNACASGANAIGEAYRLIKAGYNGPFFAGGAEAPICRLCIEGYGASGALSKIRDFSASRPFDAKRDGFVLSEGACVIVLEEYESALRRGARIYGEIAGYANRTDAFHPTMPSPEGEARAISDAIKEAGLKPDDIDYVNAHATSTPLGDKAEADAIKIVFGKRANEISVSSVKSMTGHMLSASGAFEAAVTLRSIREGLITPTINLSQKDLECDLNIVTQTKKFDIKTAVSGSFGFGGVNAVLVFRKVV